MKPFEQQTYYELLEIPVTAPEMEIRAAYERAIETYSPDSVAVYTLVEPGQIDALRARLTEAMEILTDSDLRQEYDRMIGVEHAKAGGVVGAMAPALAAAAQAVQPQDSVSPKAEPASAAPTPSPTAAPASTTMPEVSAPVAVAASAPAPAPEVKAAPEVAPTPEASTASTPAAASPAVPAAGAVSPGQFVMPGAVTPGQIHAAFRSYAISYVPVSSFLSPISAPTQTDGPQPAQETKAAAPSTPTAAPASESVPPQAAAPVSEPVPPQAPTSVATAEVAAPSTNSTVPAPASSGEPTPGPVAPTATAAAGSAPPAAEKAPAEASRPQEPTPAPAASEQVAPAPKPHEDNELSGARAPVPSPGEARATAAKPGSASPSTPSGRSGRLPTPPPLPPGSRRISRSTPTVQPGGSAGEAGKGSARPQPAAGMNLEEAQQIAQESAIATAEAALAQVAAKAREPRPKPIELPPNTEFNGELLRRVRESRNLSLAQLAERTRISAKHLENVEADRYTALPATVYLRGILMNIARELVLDPLRVSRSYLALASEPKKK